VRVETVETKPGVDADEAIDALIEARARELQEQERVEASWAESVRNFNLRAKAERRKEWAAYHSGLARLHRRLANEHDEAVRRLIDGAAP
jgi:hypothetical protein